mgnify:CR=1 FL=1
MTRRVTARLAAGLAGVALLLAGCTGEVPQPEPDPTASAPFPVLDRDRMERILAEVGETIAEADAELDPELLTGRVTGPALAMRTAEYRLAEASDGERAPTPVSTASQVEAVAATEQWPRAVFVISHVPDDANLPLLLVLKQQDARSPYQLWYWTTLLPGVQTPSTAHIDSGSPQLAPDAERLVQTPAQTVAAYAGLLADPEADSAELFTDDPFRTGYTEMIEALRSTVEVAGEVEVDYSVTEDSVVAMQTADGGAVVTGVIEAVLTITKNVDGARLEAGGDIGLLMGEDAQIEGAAEASYLIPVAFTVPPGDSADPITVLGASHVLADVTVHEPDDGEEDDAEG